MAESLEEGELSEGDGGAGGGAPPNQALDSNFSKGGDQSSHHFQTNHQNSFRGGSDYPSINYSTGGSGGSHSNYHSLKQKVL